MSVVTLIMLIFFGAMTFLGRARIENSITMIMRRPGFTFIEPPEDMIRDVNTLQHLLISFLWLALPLLIIIFIASWYFSKQAIDPIEEAYIKQKEFIADASHELKTPLATISANADVLLQGSNKASKKWAEHIQTETGRMNSLVESLLYLAKIDYEVSPNIMPIDLSELLKEMLLPLEAVIFEKNIELTENITDGIIINADKLQLQRLFGILIDNAIKYTDGKINITTEKTNSYANIIIQNSGEPIPKEKIDKLFDRFYRADESHQYNGGFGLGLSIAKAIVEKYNGEITCKSDEKNGTMFKVSLRLKN